MDNNCNGQVDEGYGIGTPCQAGEGACLTEGHFACTSVDTSACDAVAGTPSTEVCDGVDNDCNGTADDHVMLAPQAATAQAGAGGLFCDEQNVLLLDGNLAGLARATTSNSNWVILDGHYHVSCVYLDFGSTFAASMARVYSMTALQMCGDGAQMGYDLDVTVYWGSTVGSLHFVGDAMTHTALTPPHELTINTPGPGRYLALCRGGAGDFRSNIAVDYAEVEVVCPQ